RTFGGGARSTARFSFTSDGEAPGVPQPTPGVPRPGAGRGDTPWRFDTGPRGAAASYDRSFPSGRRAAPGAPMLVRTACAPRSARRARVVIGLPNPVRRARLGDVLRRDGYQVFDAVDGEALFRVVRATVLNLVVSDLWMPACSGLDVLQRLREACWSLP